MTEQVKQWTAVDIARDTGKQLYEVLRVVEKLDIQCIDVVGARRVFSDAQKQEVEKALKNNEVQS